MKLHFLGANRQVTGSRYLLETDDLRVMIDCGMFQERCCLERNWAAPPVEPESVDHLLLTHAHLDHCGLIPRFVAQGYRNPVWATPATIDLADLVLTDSARIQEEDAAYKARRHQREGRKGPHPEVPLYGTEDAEKALRLFRAVEYGRPMRLGRSMEAVWNDAGHILGSAILEVRVQEAGKTTRIVFSGDLGQRGHPLMHDPTVVEEADYVILESTYGDRDHDGSGDVEANLERIVKQTMGRGGNVVIPTFAIDRAQELLHYLGVLVEAGRIPKVQVYLDSPMAVDATEIYTRYQSLLEEGARRELTGGRGSFHFPGLRFVRTPEESRKINDDRTPSIIMAGSGMCTGGRIKHHLRHNLHRPECTILFVGYQADDTLGRLIVDGEDPVRIHGHYTRVRARIEQLQGLSAHADQTGLIRWAEQFNRPPDRLFLTHGERRPAMMLAAEIEERLGWTVSVPEYLQQYALDGR